MWRSQVADEECGSLPRTEAGAGRPGLTLISAYDPDRRIAGQGEQEVKQASPLAARVQRLAFMQDEAKSNRLPSQKATPSMSRDTVHGTGSDRELVPTWGGLAGLCGEFGTRGRRWFEERGPRCLLRCTQPAQVSRKGTHAAIRIRKRMEMSRAVVSVVMRNPFEKTRDDETFHGAGSRRRYPQKLTRQQCAKTE